MVIHWQGMIDLMREVDAENEEDAKKKMAEELIKELQNKETEFLVWEHP